MLERGHAQVEAFEFAIRGVVAAVVFVQAIALRKLAISGALESCFEPLAHFSGEVLESLERADFARLRTGTLRGVGV